MAFLFIDWLIFEKFNANLPAVYVSKVHMKVCYNFPFLYGMGVKRNIKQGNKQTNKQTNTH